MLLYAISNTEFLVGLVVADRLAGVLRPLALALQEKGADLSKVLDLVGAVITVLQQLRSNNDKFSPLMAKVESLAKQLDVEVKKPRLLERSLHRSSAGAQSCTEDYYRINVLNPAVDFALQDLRLRFGEHTKLVSELSSAHPPQIHR